MANPPQSEAEAWAQARGTPSPPSPAGDIKAFSAVIADRMKEIEEAFKDSPEKPAHHAAVVDFLSVVALQYVRTGVLPALSLLPTAPSAPVVAPLPAGLTQEDAAFASWGPAAAAIRAGMALEGD